LPTWGEELKELGELIKQAEAGTLPPDASPFDVLRRKYLKRLSDLTGRATIVYATAYLEGKDAPTSTLSVDLGDKQGFMEAVSNVTEREVDLFLHSPGGSAEAAEALMEYLRTRFDHIRAVVPIAAMSAATMMALAADEILMGSHSQLGPIDPQLTIFTPEGPRSAPAQAIIDQFQKAKEECRDPANIAAWLPILRSYGPGLLAVCDDQRQLAEEYVARVLRHHMFNGDPDAERKGKDAAAWFADYKAFKSHGRRVSPEDARDQGIKVIDLEADDALQDAVLSVHHAVAHTLSGTAAVKIVENQHGRAWIRAHQTQVIQVQGPAPPQPQPTAPNRAERRRQQRGR
jgi:Serine dehydrogenase proteinase